jgi:hypothetical protein
MNRMLTVLFIIVCFTPAFAKTGDLQVLSDILEERIKSRRPEWELFNKHVDNDSMLIVWQNAHGKWPMLQINNGCHRHQPLAAVNGSRVILVVLFLIRENLAITGQTYDL